METIFRSMRKILITAAICIYASLAASPQYIQKYIMTDQFGYRPGDEKVAVIIDPQDGYNETDEFIPGNTYQVRVWETDEVVFSGEPVPYNNAQAITAYGDRGWWFDFSSVTGINEYYIYDVEKEVGSGKFRIHPCVYRDVLQEAVRMFYYQRINDPKEEPWAHPDWTDPAAFMGSNQDSECHAVWDKANASLVRDLSGGWMDAGDVNKYVTFAESAIHQLLLAYERNPSAFRDDYGIPESGNGIPDILDEVKYELEWIKKMQDFDDGGVHIKMGEINYNGSAPPSTDTRPRYYGPKCSSSSIATAGMFAHAYLVFSGIAGLGQFADDLLLRAEMAYGWYTTHAKSENCDSQEIKSGDADRSIAEQEQTEVVAAIYLFAATGNSAYHDIVKARYQTLQPYLEPFWSLKYPVHGDALMYYTTLDGSDPATVSNLIGKRVSEGNSSEFYRNNDLYRGYMPTWAYWWGSNSVKANVGIMNYDFINYGIDQPRHDQYRNHALGILHFFHGVNPFGLVFLSNMYHAGAEKSCDEIYHTWFSDNTPWDNAVTGIGPAPGYLPGGINIYDQPDLPMQFGNTVYPTTIPEQPQLKRYSETNAFNSWSVTEPAIYYQASYIYLLSAFVGEGCDESFIDGSTTSTDHSPGTKNRNGFDVYPNPNNGQFTVELDQQLQGEKNVRISDLAGNEVLSRSFEGSGLTFSIEATALLSSGVYLIRLMAGDQVYVRKFVVE